MRYGANSELLVSRTGFISFGEVLLPNAENQRFLVSDISVGMPPKVNLISFVGKSKLSTKYFIEYLGSRHGQFLNIQLFAFFRYIVCLTKRKDFSNEAEKNGVTRTALPRSYKIPVPGILQL